VVKSSGSLTTGRDRRASWAGSGGILKGSSGSSGGGGAAHSNVLNKHVNTWQTEADPSHPPRERLLDDDSSASRGSRRVALLSSSALLIDSQNSDHTHGSRTDPKRDLDAKRDPRAQSIDAKGDAQARTPKIDTHALVDSSSTSNNLRGESGTISRDSSKRPFSMRIGQLRGTPSEMLAGIISKNQDTIHRESQRDALRSRSGYVDVGGVQLGDEGLLLSMEARSVRARLHALYIQVCMCEFVCIFLCIYMYMYVNVSLCMYVWMDGWMYAC
jgi:hypothetical protein